VIARSLVRLRIKATEFVFFCFFCFVICVQQIGSQYFSFKCTAATVCTTWFNINESPFCKWNVPPHTWGRKQIQFPKPRVFYFLEHHTMKKIQKPTNFKCIYMLRYRNVVGLCNGGLISVRWELKFYVIFRTVSGFRGLIQQTACRARFCRCWEGRVCEVRFEALTAVTMKSALSRMWRRVALQMLTAIRRNVLPLSSSEYFLYLHLFVQSVDINPLEPSG
jgi:hypothetical protein